MAQRIDRTVLRGRKSEELRGSDGAVADPPPVVVPPVSTYAAVVGVSAGLPTVANPATQLDPYRTITAGGFKSPIRGMVAIGQANVGSRAADLGGVSTVNVNWSDLQPTNGGAIDTASASWASIQAAKATGLPVLLRIFAGDASPTWAKNLNGGPLTIIDNFTSGTATTYTVPKWWLPSFLALAADFMTKMGLLLDPDPQIRAVAFNPATTNFAEPMIRQVTNIKATAGVNTGYTNVQLYYQAGLTGAQLNAGGTPIAPDPQDAAAMMYPFELVSGVPRWRTWWPTTLYYMPFSPVQTWKVTNSSTDPNVFAYNISINPSDWTQNVALPQALAALGAQLVVGNNTVRVPLIQAGTEYPPMWQAISASGATQAYQTATQSRITAAYQTVVPGATDAASLKATIDVACGKVTVANDPLTLISSPVNPGLKACWLELPSNVNLLSSAECLDYNNRFAAQPIMTSPSLTDRENLMLYIQTECRTQSGFSDPVLFDLFHSYESNFPTSWLGFSAADNDNARGMHSMVNLKLKDSTNVDLVPDFVANTPAAINKLIAVVNLIKANLGAGKIMWLFIEHEPEDDVETGRYTAAQWRAAVARAIQTIIANRGTADIRPGFVLMRYTWDPLSGRTPSNYNPAAELNALGVPLSSVYFGIDGYAQDPLTVSPATILDPPFTEVTTSWGFSRNKLVIAETGAKGWYINTAHTTQTGADIAKANARLAALPGWIDQLAQRCEFWNVQAVAWFMSGVGGQSPPEGWWLYDNAAKAKFGRFAHYGRYVP